MFTELSEWDTEYGDISASNECSLMFNTAVVNFSTEIEKKVTNTNVVFMVYHKLCGFPGGSVKNLPEIQEMQETGV